MAAHPARPRAGGPRTARERTACASPSVIERGVRSRAVPAAFRGLALRGGGPRARVAVAPGQAAIILDGAHVGEEGVRGCLAGYSPAGTPRGGPTARVACAPEQRDNAFWCPVDHREWCVRPHRLEPHLERVGTRRLAWPRQPGQPRGSRAFAPWRRPAGPWSR